MCSWFRRKTVDPPADLREQLFRAIQQEDFVIAAQLTNRYREVIHRSFAAWRRPPETLWGNSAEVEQWARTLYLIAKFFERQGDPSLLASFTDGGPFQKWNDALGEADRLADTGAPERAIQILDELWAEIDQVDGNARDHYRPIVLGRKAIAFAKAGKRDEAIALTQQALALCQAKGDQEGIAAYTNNLRALGTFELPAAAGRGALRIEDESGTTLTPDQFRAHTGAMKWQVTDWKQIPPEAQRLHEEGRKAGERKEYDVALRLFTEAANVDPAWPYPIYDRAFTHLLKGDRTAALEDYQAVLALAPDGFYTTRRFVDLLTREMHGDLPDGFTRSFESLQWLPPAQQAHLLAQIVERFSWCAAAWEAWAKHESDPERRLEILEKGLAAQGDPDTHASLQVNKAGALIGLGRTDEGKALLMTVSSGESATGRAMAEIVHQRAGLETCGEPNAVDGTANT